MCWIDYLAADDSAKQNNGNKRRFHQGHVISKNERVTRHISTTNANVSDTLIGVQEFDQLEM